MTDWAHSVRLACFSDAPDLHRNCFPERSLKEVRDYLTWCLRQESKGRIVRLVAEVDGQVVGNGQLTLYGREGEIGSLVVAPTHREQGIGQALLDALIREAGNRGAQAIEIATRADTPWVQAWYRRQGFALFAERTMPDGERIVALRMSL